MAKANIYDMTLKSPSGMGWLGASVTGNGKIGASVLGAFSNEQILVNHRDLKHKGYTGVLQDISDKFPQVRKLYADAKVIEAEKLLSTEFSKKGYKPSPALPMPFFSFAIDFANPSIVTDYERKTNMQSGEISVSYKSGGTWYERNLFVSRSNDIIAYNVTKSGPDSISLKLQINHDKNVSNPTIKYEGGYVYFAARLLGVGDYGMVARVIIPNGEIVKTEGNITIKSASAFTLLAKTFVGGTKDTEFKKLKDELGAIKHTYDKLQGANEAVHKKLFTATNLSLGKSTPLAMEELLSHAQGGSIVPQLLEKLWNYAKFISISGGGSVTGLWNHEWENKKSLTDFNNTAQLLFGGVVESFTPDALLGLFEYFDKYADDLKKNASRVYGARGYFVPSVISPDSALMGSAGADVIHFVSSSALAANLFFEYFLVTGDVKILKSKIWPFMKQVFAFYSDILKLDTSGYYSTVPSYSPNSTPGNIIKGKPLENFKLSTNSTIDWLSIGVLLDNLVYSAEVLGSTEDVIVWNDMKTKIPTPSISPNGEIKEYTNSAFIDGAVNAGNLHIYGLYPFKTFSFDDKVVPYKPAVANAQADTTTTLGAASLKSATTRLGVAGGVQTARNLSMYASQIVHSGNTSAVSEVFARIITSTIGQSGLGMSNDWRGSGYTTSDQPSIDITTNMGIATAVTECLVQSNRENLRILPIIPQGMESGELSGVVTHFAGTISMEWDAVKGKLYLKIMPKRNVKINISFNSQFKKLKSKELSLENGMLKNINLTAGKAFVIEF